MFLGFLFGVLACLIWGVVYVVPLVLGDYSPVYIAIARYFVFAAFSAGFLLYRRKDIHLTKNDIWIASKLSIIGNLVFYWMLGEAVIRIGAAMTGLFTACIPLVASLWVFCTEGRKKKMPSKLLIALFIIAVGLFLLNVDRFKLVVDMQNEVSIFDYFVGVFFAISTVVIWTWYPINNAKWLQKHPKQNLYIWTAVQGASLLPVTSFLIIFGNLTGLQPMPMPDLHCFFWLCFLTLVCNWLGTILWNMMSKRLPELLVGQMLAFETLSAIIFASIIDRQWPALQMVIGSLIVLAGVSYSLFIIKKEEDKNAAIEGTLVKED